jgi:hypothetical protein
MDAEQRTDSTTWHWLWAHTARQVISALLLPDTYEPIQIGYGWGARSCVSQTMLLLHPTDVSHDTGELSLTIAGQPTTVIPRDGRSYTEYVEYVASVVARALEECSANKATGEPRLNGDTFTCGACESTP